MRTPILVTVALVGGGLLHGAASAQTTRPGLWEMQNKVGGNPQIDQAMAQMQQQLASMPPAQRKQMEAMLAAQGVGLGGGAGPGAVAMKICITPEMAARNELPSDGDCKTSITSRSGNTFKMTMACSNPPTQGEGTYTFQGDTAYTMKMVMKTTQKGKTETATVEGQGRWLSASCGNIKPIRP